MIYTALTKKAMRLAYEAHDGQTDKSGLPYIHHPLHVAESMTEELSAAVALLHDVVEDTDWTLEELAEEGFPAQVMEALSLLTHEKGMPYLDYVRRLAPNPLARVVKLADLTHNSDLTRLNTVTEQDRKRVAKYAKAMNILRGQAE